MPIRSLLRLGGAVRDKLRPAQRPNEGMTERPSKYLPPFLPVRPADTDLLPDSHLLAKLPCTRYWHHERRQQVMDLPPPGIPHWLRRFDWLVGWAHGWADTTTFPRHVYCHPNAMTGLLECLRSGFPEGTQGSILVVGGEDTLLSAQDPDTVTGLLRYFDKIFYEAFDKEIDGVGIMPIGLQEFYLRGFEDSVSRAIYGAKDKHALLISAFGKFWPGLNETNDDRRLAAEFTAEFDGATKGPFSQDEYFQRIANHHFMICPRGNGVQAPKLMEGFLTCCTPIVTDSPMARALIGKGAPILVVDTWRSVTPDLLNSRLPEFSDRAKAFYDVASDLDAWWTFSFDT